MEEVETFQDKLRVIFDHYDDDNDGYITVNHVQQALSNEQFGAARQGEITGVVNLLDPEGSGVISFDGFCEGVRQLRALHSDLPSPDPSLSGSCSIETLVPIEGYSPEHKKEDSRHTEDCDISSFEQVSASSLLEDFIGSANPQLMISATSGDEGDSVISTSENNHSRQEITDEENFEDYGESEADVSDTGLLTPSTLRKHRHKKELLARSRNRSSPDDSYNGRRSSFGSDIVYGDIDDNFHNIDDRMKFLETQIHKLSDDQNTTRVALKKENSSLKAKVHDLETQLELMEVRSEEKLEKERRKNDESMSKHRKLERDAQMDYVTQRLVKVEGENDELKKQLQSLKTELQQTRAEKFQRQESFDSLTDEHLKLRDELQKVNQQMDRERRSTGELLDELGKELDELRRYKIEHEAGQGRKFSLGDLPSRYQDLELEVNNLRRENAILKDSNEDLNAQLLARCMEEGRNLLRDAGGTTLAEELEQLNKDELLELLKKEKEMNSRLKQYVDRILLTVIDKNPSLLEITK